MGLPTTKKVPSGWTTASAALRARFWLNAPLTTRNSKAAEMHAPYRIALVVGWLELVAME
jgi:hypothetical protein